MKRETKPARQLAERSIQRQSLPNTLAASLQERILRGEFEDGDALIQETIAEEYDVSRMPVREALRQLEACGLVTMRTHRGAVVTTVPTEQIEELFELRATLEPEVLARAIDKLTDDDIAAASRILDELQHSYKENDVKNWGRLNWEFHKCLYAPAERVQTLAILQGINVQIERYLRLHLLLTDGSDRADHDHRDLLRLCVARDVQGATNLLRAHILHTSRSLLAALREHRSATMNGAHSPD